MPLPFANDFNGFFACQRGVNNDIKSYDDLAKYIQYAKSKGDIQMSLMNGQALFANALTGLQNTYSILAKNSSSTAISSGVNLFIISVIES